MSSIFYTQRPTSSSRVEVDHPPSCDLPDDAIQSLFDKSILDFSLPEIRHLEDVRKAVKCLEGNKSDRYLRLKTLVKDVRMAHLPLRSYELWKRGSYAIIKSGGSVIPKSFFKNRMPADKSSRKRTKADLFEMCSPPHIQERLKLLSRITFLHGSSTAALAMMHGQSEPVLECTGSLLSRGVTPMGGVNDTGISSTGVNTTMISTESIRDIKRLRGYTNVKSFNPSWIHALNPFSQILDSGGIPLIATALATWKKEYPEEFAQNFSLGSFKRNKLIELLKHVIPTIESRKNKLLASFDNPEELARICWYNTPDIKDTQAIEQLKSEMCESYDTPLKAMSILVSQLENGDEFSPDPSIQLTGKDYPLKSLRNLFAEFSSEPEWNIKAIRILQIKQWDHALFDQHIRPFSTEWMAAIEQVRAFHNNHLIQLIKIMEHSFTEEEKTFIDNIRSNTNSSANPLPIGLQNIFTSSAEIGSYGCMDTTQSLTGLLRNYYLISKNADWRPLIRELINLKINGYDLSLQKRSLEEELERTERSYQNIARALSDEPAAFQIPQDPTIRSLITRPAPIIFASTTVKPFPLQNKEWPHEFVLHTPTKLGREGCNVIFTDTESSLERIKSAIPENLHEEIQFRFLTDLDVGVVPLVHSPDQINPFIRRNN